MRHERCGETEPPMLFICNDRGDVRGPAASASAFIRGSREKRELKAALRCQGSLATAHLGIPVAWYKILARDSALNTNRWIQEIRPVSTKSNHSIILLIYIVGHCMAHFVSPSGSARAPVHIHTRFWASTRRLSGVTKPNELCLVRAWEKPHVSDSVRTDVQINIQDQVRSTTSYYYWQKVTPRQ